MAVRKFTYISSEGFAQEQASTDELSLGKVTAVGVSGIAFDASSQRIVNVATPTSASDAAPKSYVDAVAQGLDTKASCRLATAAALPAYTPSGTGVGKTLTANANGALSVDGVAVAVGNRILVKSEAASHVDHGIYTVTAAGSGGAPYVLTRATDFDEDSNGGGQDEVKAGAYTFITEGTSNADSGWLLVTNDPITIDVTAQQWTQFSSTVAYTFDAGLLNSGGSISVELDTGADAQGAGSGGGSSGLEFDTSGAAGKLRAKVDGSGGIQRTASGLALEIDDTPDTLDVGAAGLKVVGVPSLFKINGTNTSANVTAANLGTLTAGTSSYADALHTHKLKNLVNPQVTTSENVTLGDPVVWSSTNNQLAKGDAANDPDSRVIGIAMATQTAGNPVDVLERGPAVGVLAGATAGAPYYLAAGGGLTATTPAGSGNRIILIGYAINATDLDVRITDYGKKA